jgi:hypothetical protein
VSPSGRRAERGAREHERGVGGVSWANRPTPRSSVPLEKKDHLVGGPRTDRSILLSPGAMASS